MTGRDLLMAMSYVDGRYVEESEGKALPGKSENARTGRKVLNLRRPALVAAIIAMALLLAGCGAVIYLTLAESPLFDLPRVEGAQVPADSIQLTVDGVSPGGMHVQCDLKGFGDEEKAIFIRADGPYTLDRKTEDGWEPLERKVSNTEYKGQNTMTDGHYDWYVSWGADYGLLEPGTYRMNAEILEGHDPISVEFAVTAQGETIKTVQALLEAECYHYRVSGSVRYEGVDQVPKEHRAQFEEKQPEYYDDYYKLGEDYLNLTYQDGKLYMGAMYRDGVKYKLTNENPDTRLSPIAGWEVWPDYDVNRMTADLTYLLDTTDEVQFEYDSGGNLQKAVSMGKNPSSGYPGVTTVYTNCLEVLSTDKETVAEAFQQQDVNFWRAFDWEKEQKQYPALNVSFQNTTAQPITTSAEAIDRANNERTAEEVSQIVVYRDEKAGMWKVEYQILYGYQGYQFVYLNDDGITVMVSGAGSKEELWKDEFPDPAN